MTKSTFALVAIAVYLLLAEWSSSYAARSN